MNTSQQNTSWTWFGVAAFVLGYVATWLVVFIVSYDDAKIGGPVLIDAIESGNNELLFRVSSGVGMVAACCLVVFATGLRRTIQTVSPEGSLLPAVIYASFLGTAVLLAIGFIIRGIVFDSVGAYGDDPRIAFYVLGLDVPLAAWSLLGLGAAASAYGAFRMHILPRWFGIASAIAAVLVLATWATGTLPPGNIPAGLWLLASVFAFRSLPQAAPVVAGPVSVDATRTALSEA